MKIDFSRGFIGYAADGAENAEKGPKNETLEEHLKHCKAESPEKCPFVKAKEAEAGKEDEVAPAAPEMPPKKRAELFQKAIGKAAEEYMKGLKFDDLQVSPNYIWNPGSAKEELVGFSLAASMKNGGDKCEKFLDMLKDKFGIERKPKDAMVSGDGARIYTHITNGEVDAVMKGIEAMKDDVVAQKKSAEQKEAEAKQKAERSQMLDMAAYAVLAAAKSVNFHVSHGDFAADKQKVDAALVAKGDIEDAISGKHGEPTEVEKARADALLKAVAEIKESYYDGKHTPVSKIPDDVLKPTSKKPKAVEKPVEEKGISQKELAQAHAAILTAVKSINYHIQQGDYKPNPSSLDAMKIAAKWVSERCPDGKCDNKDVKALYDTMCEVSESAKSGWKKGIGMMKPLSGASAPKKPVASKSPFEHFVETMLHGKAKKPAAAPKESPDAHNYDSDAWKHLDFTHFNSAYMKGLADGMSNDEMKESLSLCFGGASGGNPPSHLASACKAHNGIAEDSALFKDSVGCAAAAMKDLHARFPNMKFPKIDTLFVSKPKNIHVGAEFVRDGDENTAICFHANYGDVSHGGTYSFGHQDSRYPFDVLRHELAHAIGKGEVHAKWKKFVGETYGFPATGFFKVMKEKVSKYAAAHKPGVPTPDIYESLAEVFSKMTSHDYKPGTLPLPIENFVYTNMLGESKKGA